MGEMKSENGTIGLSPKLLFGMAAPATKRSQKTRTNWNSPQASLFGNGDKKARRSAPALPTEDNTPEGLRSLLKANAHYREMAWPEPYHRTKHHLHLGDARDLGWIPDASVHLVVTSPPYWTLKPYAPGNADQMGHFEDYEHFLNQLDRVWRANVTAFS